MSTAPDLLEYLEYADLQMAAEAFIRDDVANTFSGSGLDLIRALVRGNDHASRFTEPQAIEFEKHWEVIDQCANTTTGFSGTLFRNKDTNELVMSIRSTEFIDDAARDNKATNVLEIKDTGFAWGQIRDMEAWYEELKQSGKLPPGQPFAVTGYSLGAHLATIFNLLHGPLAPLADQAGISEVVTFNGAGVGGFDESLGLKRIVQYFIADAGRSPTFADAPPEQIYERVKGALQAGQKASLSDMAALNVLANAPVDGSASVAQTRVQAKWVIDAVGRINIIRAEVVRLRTITSDGNGNGSVPADWLDSQIAQEGLDYQMAVLKASVHTDASNLREDYALTFGDKQYLNEKTRPKNQYDVVGDTSPSAVANSEWHIGQDVRVFIEDQPTYRGGVIKDVILDFFTLNGFNLLVDGYAKKDFGDTHSLVLIVDSLNVQNTLLGLLPQPQRATWAQQVDAILKDASNWVKVDGDGSFGTGQGQAEGNVLENVVNALLVLTKGPEYANANRLIGSRDANTWWGTNPSAVDGKLTNSGRTTFYEALDQIKKSDINTAVEEGRLGLQLLAPSEDLATKARKDIGAYAALYSLSPFAFSFGTEEQADAFFAQNWGDTYAQWKSDKSALLAAESGRRSDAEMQFISDQWLKDRAALLTRKVYFNDLNADYDSSQPPSNGQDHHPSAPQYDSEDIVWEDRNAPEPFKILRDKVTANTRYVIFADRSTALTSTGGRRDDRLYGGQPAGTLAGGGGNDTGVHLLRRHMSCFADVRK